MITKDGQIDKRYRFGVIYHSMIYAVEEFYQKKRLGNLFILHDIKKNKIVSEINVPIEDLLKDKKGTIKKVNKIFEKNKKDYLKKERRI